MDPCRLFFLCFAMATAACSTASDEAESAAETNTPLPTMEADVRDRRQGSLTLEDSVAAAREDLAGHLGLEIDSIEVAEARRVTWPDGAMGCPEPGMHYTMALVDGYLIRLIAGGKPFAYHAGHDGQPFLCPAERSRAPHDGDELS